MSSDLLQPLTHKLRSLEIKQTARLLLVSLDRQCLQLLHEEKLLRKFPISTSRNPPSCQENSFGTPSGLHRIGPKIGAAAALGSVFKGRVAIGKRYWELSEAEQRENLITSRILRLEGLEPGYNLGGSCDSFRRYIYIHGTNHEEMIGTAASGGCIQLRNKDMIELFDAVESGDLVFIG